MKKMKWKQKLILITIFIFSYILLIYAFDNKLTIVKGFLYAMILAFASLQDIKNREISDLIHVLILIVGCIDIQLWQSLIGLILVPIPYLVPALIHKDSIGGGDIKLMATSGFLLGSEKGFVAGIVGLILAIFINTALKIIRKNKDSNSFPMAPYLSIGCFLSYLLG